MKWFKRLAIGALALVLILLVVGLIMPSAWTVSRSRVIAATPTEIHTYVGDWDKWPEWSPFENEDPGMVITVEGVGTGVGAKRSWTSESMGAGSQTITATDPEKGMSFVLAMDGMEMQGEIAYEVVPEGTRVTWTDRGDMGGNPFMRLFVPMLEGMLGESFERGLVDLDAAVTQPSE